MPHQPVTVLALHIDVNVCQPIVEYAIALLNIYKWLIINIIVNNYMYIIYNKYNRTYLYIYKICIITSFTICTRVYSVKSGVQM